ncbi:homoserine O-acetyltransferase [Microthyrium microscopicum]|uniref:Homoserine O-acetyltransferase n=1 Tax=Microthyrium microscopicum TaxID=703497 RepID=A0A6A6UTY2_9PEZI|nr:homoserine O-acetyltransferase [Microthyrium microscopicum]
MSFKIQRSKIMAATPESTRANGSHKPFERVYTQPENQYANLVPSQTIAIVPSFALESGVTLENVPVAYKTFGKLSPNGDNCMVICHALTGSADVADWWGPLLGGSGKAFDKSRFFVVCFNCLGSPYGSASPVTSKNGDRSQGIYGPEFPLTTIRDDVNIFKIVLDDLGVRQTATVIGGSMGGGTVLEFAFLGQDYVRSIIPIATSARYSAWGISWGEAQRQSIYSDPKYDDGYYAQDDPPSTGLGAARMSALLTYRSRDSFEKRFGRNIPDPSRRQNINTAQYNGNHHFAIHNDGHKHAGSPRPSRVNSTASINSLPPPSIAPTSAVTTSTSKISTATSTAVLDPEFSGTPEPLTPPPSAGPKKRTPTYFSAQSYLRYQGDKFISRFDANCYIAITRKLDTHDVSRNRDFEGVEDGEDPLHAALATISQPTLVLGIQSDGLFTFAEQEELAATIPNAVLKTIDSSEGHDAFLLEFEQVNAHLVSFMKEVLPDIMERESDAEAEATESGPSVAGKGMVSEVDDITAW